MYLKKRPPIPDIPEQDQTPLVKTLLAIIEQLVEQVQLQAEEIARLKDEINILKGEKKRPTFKPSKLDKQTDTKATSDKSTKKRPGSNKRKKTRKLSIHEDVVIKQDEPVPPGSRFKGYREFTVQDLDISSHNTRYRLEHWLTPDNKTLTGQLPSELSQRTLALNWSVTSFTNITTARQRSLSY
jgi:hypothetical protein